MERFSPEVEIHHASGQRLRFYFNLLSRMALALILLGLGCGDPRKESRQPFRYEQSWRLEQQFQDEQWKGITLSAKLSPQPVYADRPAFLEVRIQPEDLQIFKGQVWYRFAHRRGDRLPEHKDLATPPPIEAEEGVDPRYEDWFDWAEVVEPRFENGVTIFETPVMLSEGKAYVQFRLTPGINQPPRELLNWFIYVEPLQ